MLQKRIAAQRQKLSQLSGQDCSPDRNEVSRDNSAGQPAVPMNWSKSWNKGWGKYGKVIGG